MEQEDEPTEGAGRVASLFARALLGGLVALWGLLEARQWRGPTEGVVDAARAALSSLRAAAAEER
jgi:hypothetical protein